MTTDSNEPTVSLPKTMTTFSGSRRDAAAFAVDMAIFSTNDCPSITITVRGKSEDSSVHIVIVTSLVGAVEVLARTYCLRRTSTWTVVTPDG